MNIYKYNWLFVLKFINICNEFWYMLIESKIDIFFMFYFLILSISVVLFSMYLNFLEIFCLFEIGIELKLLKICKIL